MRTTLNIPDQYYNQIKEKFELQGFTTLNDFLLDLIRHHFDAPASKSIISQAPTIVNEPPRQQISTPSPIVVEESVSQSDTPYTFATCANCQKRKEVTVRQVIWEYERKKAKICDNCWKQAELEDQVW